MRAWNAWLHAARLRTLPLALACVLMGAILAFIDGHVNYPALLLAILTTILLQVLSNFANDYGDYSSGVDLKGRIGPVRAMQGGHINAVQMKRAIIVTSVLALFCGIGLLWISNVSLSGLLTLLIIGILSILAAITYTIGKRPYGYRGLGDLAVLLFFGLVGVLGSHYVINGQFYSQNILIAFTIGFFSVGVLNLNNIRDLEADREHNKNTIPVWLGAKKAKIYHSILLAAGWFLAMVYTFLYHENWTQFLILLVLPLFVRNIILLWKKENKAIDPLLKQLALATLGFVILFGIVWILL